MFKFNYALIASLFLSVISPAAFGAFSIAELVAANSLALKDFESKQASHVAHFNGYKAWKSGEDAKVKIYVLHDGMNMEFDYVCHKHLDAMECHAQ